MKAKGRITTWNDDKGFGFIRPFGGGDDTFVHTKAFRNPSRRPVVGDVVTFTRGADRDGRPRAEGAVLAGDRPARRSAGPPGHARVWIGSAFLAVMAGGVWSDVVPVLPLAAWLVMSLVTFGVYWMDKRAAERGSWRTSEGALHLCALLGGWPGALFAQSLLRHKTRKQPFVTLFWISVVLNFVAFGWLASIDTSELWRALQSAGR